MAEKTENEQPVSDDTDQDELDQPLPLHIVRGTKIPTPAGTWIRLWKMQKNK